jgi:hypothetical protein
MSLMAKHSRIFWPEPKNDDVRRLNLAVTNVQAWMQGLTSEWRAIELAAKIARAIETEIVDDDLADAVEKAIVESGSDAFVRDGNDLLIAVVAIVAALDLVRNSSVGEAGWGTVDAFAAASWSALSFQKAVDKEGLEMLRIELLQASQERTKEVAENSRIRSEVPEVGLLSISDAVPPNARAKTAFKTAVEPLVKALRENAELDREEIDFLWWRMSNWSDTLEQPFSEFSEIKRAIVSGLEGGAKLRRVPASGHRNVILQGVFSADTFNLADVVGAIGADAQKLTANHDEFSSAAQVFPLLYAMVSGEAESYGSDVARTARDWGARALLEAGVMHLSSRQG